MEYARICMPERSICMYVNICEKFSKKYIKKILKENKIKI